MVEVNAETDFVARNEQFQNFVAELAGLALSVGDDIEKLKAAPYPGTRHSVAEELTRLIATIGENMTIRRAKRLAVGRAWWRPTPTTPSSRASARSACWWRCEGRPRSTRSKASAGRSACMSPPPGRRRSTSPASIPRRWSARRPCCSEQARASGKPEAIIEKMVEGRIRKYYEEVVLLEQVWVHDGESRVKAVVQEGRRPR